MSILSLLYYMVWVINHCVELYFETFYILFSKCVMVISNLVMEYFIVFEKLFKYCTTYPQIVWFTIIIGLTYLFILKILQLIFK